MLTKHYKFHSPYAASLLNSGLLHDGNNPGYIYLIRDNVIENCGSRPLIILQILLMFTVDGEIIEFWHKTNEGSHIVIDPNKVFSRNIVFKGWVGIESELTASRKLNPILQCHAPGTGPLRSHLGHTALKCPQSVSLKICSSSCPLS